MSRVFSFSDLRLIPELSRYNEISLLSPKLDGTVNGYLAKLGFDITQAIQYIPAKHRNMQGKVVIGYRAVGTINRDREFINSPFCSTIERLIAASTYDMSLTRELAKLMGSSVQLKDDDAVEMDENYPEEWVEADFEEVQARIRTLEVLRDRIRGSMYNEYGALKRPYEYQEV
jgi:hypothetical protein